MPTRIHRPQIRPQVRFEDPHTEIRLRDTIQDLLHQISGFKADNKEKSKEITSLNNENAHLRGTVDRLRGERNIALAWEENYRKDNKKLKEQVKDMEHGAGVLEKRLRQWEDVYVRLVGSGWSGLRNGRWW